MGFLKEAAYVSQTQAAAGILEMLDSFEVVPSRHTTVLLGVCACLDAAPRDSLLDEL